MATASSTIKFSSPSKKNPTNPKWDLGGKHARLKKSEKCEKTTDEAGCNQSDIEKTEEGGVYLPGEDLGSMPKIIYLPAEAYTFSASEYLSVPGGVYESLFQEYSIPYLTIRPSTKLFNKIVHGDKFDIYTRTIWSFTQIGTVSAMLSSLGSNTKDRSITPEDVILFENKWSPGKDSLELLQKQMGLSFPRMFTNTERIWNCTAVQKVSRVPVPVLPTQTGPWIVVSSDLTIPKDANLLLTIIEKVIGQDSEAKFIICTGHSSLVADPDVKIRLLALINKHPSNIEVELELKKSEYFKILSQSRVYLCCSPTGPGYGLLEATMYGCAPICPDYFSYQDALNRCKNCLFPPQDVSGAVERVLSELQKPKGDWSWVVKKADITGPKLLYKMGFNIPWAATPDLDALSVEDVKRYFNGR